MPDRLHHPARKGFAYFGAFNSDDTADAAHSSLLYRERSRSSTVTCKCVCALRKSVSLFPNSEEAAHLLILGGQQSIPSPIGEGFGFDIFRIVGVVRAHACN
jgi:hypothetical protein